MCMLDWSIIAEVKSASIKNCYMYQENNGVIKQHESATPVKVLVQIINQHYLKHKFLMILAERIKMKMNLKDRGGQPLA